MCPSHENSGNWHLSDDQNEKSLFKEDHYGMVLSTQNGLKKGPWTTAEDEILADYVKKHGEGNWNSVQKNTKLLRCGKSCRLRWVNHLRPNLKKGAFTADEEKRVIELHAKMGNKWAKMAAQLPGRTDNEIKNFWNTRLKKLHRAGLPLYPPELRSQSLPKSQQLDGYGGKNTDDEQDNFVQSMNPSIPEIKFNGYRVDQDLLPCILEDTNLHYNGMVMMGTAGLQYPYVSLANHHTKRLREFTELFDGQYFSSGNGFTHANQTQSSYHDPFPTFQQHDFPLSSAESKLLDFELPSVQNVETQMVSCKKSHLSTLSHDPIYDVYSPSVAIGGSQFEKETNSKKNGLLQSLCPVFTKSLVSTTDLSSYDHGFRSKSRKVKEPEISEDLSNPFSPFESSTSEYLSVSSPRTKRRCLSDQGAAYKAIYGYSEAVSVGQASYEDGEDVELAKCFEFSPHDPLIGLTWLSRDSVCVEDDPDSVCSVSPSVWSQRLHAPSYS